MAPPDISSNRSSLLSDVTSERNQRYASAERVVHELSGTIAREQLDNSRVRMGLASNAINDTRQAIGSFIRFLESRPELAASYQSTIEKLKERSTELGAQQKLLGESAKRSDQLAASGKTTDAILAAEPAFAKASGNTIEGLLSGAKKAIEELQRGERLLGAKDPSMFEQYQRLFVSKNVTAWTSLMIEGGPEDFTTGSNVKRGKYPGVGLTIQEALAGPSPAAVGQAIAVAGLLLPTLRETLPSFITDSQLIALPRTRITDPAQIKEGNAGYQELVRGTITEVRPRGSFNFPSLPPVEDAVSPGSPAAGDKRPSVNGAGSASSGERESRPVASASGDHRSVESKRTKAKTPQASAPSADSPASTTAPNTATDAASAAVEKPTEREANTPRSQREETRDRLRELDRAQREVSSDLAAAVSTITVDKSLDEVRTILSEARSRAVERLETLHPNIESDVREWRRLRDSAARGLSPTNPNFTDWRSPERRQAEQDEQAQKALGSDGTVQIMDRVDRFVAELISKNEHVRTLSDERAIELA
ncbi:MAG: hypothetical protein IT290_00620, partial [Deltaproteobacteria bacterium]|nr:hypothetical protein [Deltaproteobacteria bacterium]